MTQCTLRIINISIISRVSQKQSFIMIEKLNTRLRLKPSSKVKVAFILARRNKSTATRECSKISSLRRGFIHLNKCYQCTRWRYVFPLEVVSAVESPTIATLTFSSHDGNLLQQTASISFLAFPWTQHPQ